MGFARRIYISVPGDHILNGNQKDLKWAIINKVEQLGYIPEIFHSERPNLGSLTAGRGWTFGECITVMKRCVGTIIIGLPRHELSTGESVLKLPTEFAHFEGALSFNLHLPTLLLKETGITDRGIFHWGGGNITTSFPENANAEWLSSEKFENSMKVFLKNLEERKDVFLGYCTTSEGTARNIKQFIERVIGATVLDWKPDFRRTTNNRGDRECKQTNKRRNISFH